MTGREYWMWMAGIPWLYYEKIKKLIGIFGSVEKISQIIRSKTAKQQRICQWSARMPVIRGSSNSSGIIRQDDEGWLS